MRGTFQLLVLTMAALVCVGGGPRHQLQPMEERGYEPVERMVEDVTRSARSLRRLETGIERRGGQETAVFRQRGEPEDGRLFYVHSGVVAEFDRSDYLMIEHRDERVIFQKIPSNTVFHIGLPRVERAESRERVDSPYRVQGRVDGRQRWRVDGEAERDDAADAQQRERAAGQWGRHRRQQESRRSAVLRTIDRLVDAEGQ